MSDDPLLSSTGLPALDPPVGAEERRSGRNLATWGMAVVIAGAALLYILDHTRPLLVPMSLAVLLNLVLGPIVRRLKAVGVPRAVGAGLVLGMGVIALTGLAFLAAPAVESWMSDLPEILRRLRTSVLDSPQMDALLNARAQAEVTTAELVVGNAVPVRLDEDNTQEWLMAGTGFLVNMVVVLFLSYLMLAAGDRFRRRLATALGDSPLQDRMLTAARQVESSVSTYVLTISAINAGLGIAVGVTMWMMGLEEPLLWGVLAAMLNFIPYIGPLVTTMLVGLGGFASWGTLNGLLIPPVVFLAINAVEAFGVTPVLLGRRLRLSPVATLVSVIFWTWLWGLGGALVAIPSLVVVYVVTSHLAPLRPVAVLITR